jgi:SAM-dependent methyltransferase
MSWQDRYYAKYYDRSKGFKDGTTEFHEICAHALPRGARILEIGAGPINETSRFLSGIGPVTGIDPDPDVLHNEALAAAHVLEGEGYPFERDTFDGAVSDFVVEHVEQPVSHLSEVSRVLKPGAPYIFRTPNRFHYVAITASLTPHWFHVKVANRLRNLPPAAHDPYPTVYRMNTRGALRQAVSASGMRIELLRLIEKDPSYGRASRMLFFPFMFYERIVNATDLLEGLRANMLVTLRAPSGT